MSKLLLIAVLFSINGIIYAQPALPSNTVAKIDSFLRGVYNDTLPGASIAVLQNNSIVFEKSYGVSNIRSKTNITSRTNFNIASLTKQFTAMAILQLAAKGKFSLDDKLSRFFPGMNKRVANAIMIRHLLTHTSGIIDHYGYANTDGLKHAHNADVYKAIKNVDSSYFN